MVLVFTVDEVLQKGLVLIGFDRYRQQSVSRVTNLVRFRAHFGSDPVVYAQIWEDLQMIPDGNNDHPKEDFNYFLMSVHFLWRYPTEQEQTGRVFKVCDKSARSWSWYYA